MQGRESAGPARRAGDASRQQRPGRPKRKLQAGAALGPRPPRRADGRTLALRSPGWESRKEGRTGGRAGGRAASLPPGAELRALHALSRSGPVAAQAPLLPREAAGFRARSLPAARDRERVSKRSWRRARTRGDPGCEGLRARLSNAEGESRGGERRMPGGGARGGPPKGTKDVRLPVQKKKKKKRESDRGATAHAQRGRRLFGRRPSARTPAAPPAKGWLTEAGRGGGRGLMNGRGLEDGRGPCWKGRGQ